MSQFRFSGRVKEKGPGRGFNPPGPRCRRALLYGSIFRDNRRVPVELVVHADFPDVVVQFEIKSSFLKGRAEADGRGAGIGRIEEPARAEVDVEVFGLDRPAVAERIFPARADGPTR